MTWITTTFLMIAVGIIVLQLSDIKDELKKIREAKEKEASK